MFKFFNHVPFIIKNSSNGFSPIIFIIISACSKIFELSIHGTIVNNLILKVQTDINQPVFGSLSQSASAQSVQNILIFFLKSFHVGVFPYNLYIHRKRLYVLYTVIVKLRTSRRVSFHGFSFNFITDKQVLIIMQCV